MNRLVKGLAAVAVTLGVTQAASAQSTFGCRDLDGFHGLPSVEGNDGMFFRVEPELYNHHPFSDETVEDLARLSQSLAEQGTTLIYAPVPPKSMVMTKSLPQRAFDYGFDPDIATTLYDDMIERLQAAGVRAVNLRRALVVGAAGFGTPYFQTDYRLNTQGARISAQAIAQVLAQVPAFGRVARSSFTSQSQGKVEVDSDMRRILQRHCLIELPKTETEAFGTVAGSGFGNANTGFGTAQSGLANVNANTMAPGTTNIFSTAGQGPSIALVGTEYSATPEINFAGFLSEVTGANVQNHAIPGGGAFGSISAYMTSDAFQQARPAILIWENPVYNNLAQYGDQPMRELTAAGGGSCRLPIPVISSLDGNAVRADLSGLDPMQEYTLQIDTGGSAASMAQFTFTSPTGATRTSTVTRRTEQEKTGRFYVPVSGLWREGIRSLDIQLNASMAGTPRITACFY